MNSKPDFNKAYIKANEILTKSSVVQSFPFSSQRLVGEQSPIVCRSYRKAKKYGVDIADFGSKSAAIFKLYDKSIIFYNETKSSPHIAFSVLHEFGHDILGHDFAKKDKESYHKYEVESNFFAAQLLMPEQIIRELQKRGKKITLFFLQSTFGVSFQAANKRMETLSRTNINWHSRAEREFDDTILHHYTDFINRICPVMNYYDFEDDYARHQEKRACQ